MNYINSNISGMIILSFLSPSLLFICRSTFLCICLPIYLSVSFSFSVSPALTILFSLVLPFWLKWPYSQGLFILRSERVNTLVPVAGIFAKNSSLLCYLHYRTGTPITGRLVFLCAFQLLILKDMPKFSWLELTSECCFVLASNKKWYLCQWRYHTYTHMHTYMDGWMDSSMHTCMHVCVCIFVFVCQLRVAIVYHTFFTSFSHSCIHLDNNHQMMYLIKFVWHIDFFRFNVNWRLCWGFSMDTALMSRFPASVTCIFKGSIEYELDWLFNDVKK